jgi:hypothetical protein
LGGSQTNFWTVKEHLLTSAQPTFGHTFMAALLHARGMQLGETVLLLLPDQQQLLACLEQHDVQRLSMPAEKVPHAEAKRRTANQASKASLPWAR